MGRITIFGIDFLSMTFEFCRICQQSSEWKKKFTKYIKQAFCSIYVLAVHDIFHHTALVFAIKRSNVFQILNFWCKIAFCWISLVAEIVNGIKFHQYCCANVEQLEIMLGVMEKTKQNMTRTNNSISALMRNYTIVSRKLNKTCNLDWILKEQE